MPSLYDIIIQLTELQLSESERRRVVQDFAHHFGWTPSDTLTAATTGQFANGHLVVEHGLENTAVISFLKRPFADLGYEERKSLLNISYNNLVDWHVQIEREQVTYVFNRTEPERVVAKFSISRNELSKLSSDAFEEISDKRQNPNLPSLDDALIGTIRFWKGFLSTEIGNLDSNLELSALFNAIIFTRAVEDNFRRIHLVRTGEWLESKALIQTCLDPDAASLTLREIILRTLARFGQHNVPSHLVDPELLKVFDGITFDTVASLVENFYRIRGVRPYEYDFSVMSKHALSRIYERYVALLRVKEAPSGQSAFYFAPPEEESSKSYGGVYTPQYIARFFARYLREQMPPIAFKRLRTLEPAVGSGIFLRTLLEMQCDPLQEGVTTDLIATAFTNVTGIDKDPNATQAALLSLSLLYLVLTSQLPDNLGIYSAEAIEYFQGHAELKDSRDAVLANPPFIPIDNQPEAMRQRLVAFMGADARGRIDTYLAFLKLAVEALKSGGYGMFVLPYSFLIGNNSEGMRKLVSEKCWIRCLVDLSAIRVFEEASAYVILLIFQKKINTVTPAPPALVVKCQDLVSRALQDAVEDRVSNTDFYSLYRVSQDAFHERNWITTPPALMNVTRKLQLLPKIEKFMHVRQGFVTGADKVFIVPAEIVRELNAELFVPYLSDREMQPYAVPTKSARYVFYPFIENRKVEENELRTKYKQTWEYLERHKEALQKRSSVIKNRFPWWQPEGARRPENLMRPKIITPHIVLTPRFALDSNGNYAVSHSPLLYPKQTAVEDDLLRFFTAVLNSTVCFRSISEQAHKYGSGYSVLEVTTLRKTPVPDPTMVSPTIMRQLITLVERRLTASGGAIIDIEKQIDNIVMDLYDLTDMERHALGLEVS